jgi:ketosteroid isomerase-like protein
VTDLATNKALVLACFDAVNHGDRARVAELAAPHLCDIFDALMETLAGVQIVVQDIVAEGDKVSARGVFSGHLVGEWPGLSAAPGSYVEAGYVDMWRVEDNKLVENWVEYRQR